MRTFRVFCLITSGTLAPAYFFVNSPRKTPKDNSEACNAQFVESGFNSQNNPITPKNMHKVNTAIAKKLSVTFINMYSNIFGLSLFIVEI